MLLNLSAGSELVKCTFGHSRENVNLVKYLNSFPTNNINYHRVYPVLLVSLGEWENLDAECKEGSIKKSVHEKHLTWIGLWSSAFFLSPLITSYIEQAQELTEEIFEGPEVVIL